MSDANTNARDRPRRSVLPFQPIKGIRKITPIKRIEKSAPIKPTFKKEFSDAPLKAFLMQGSKDY